MTTHPLIALVVATIVALSAKGTWGQTGPSQEGFISIDCGAAEAYTDPVTGINWLPDANFTGVGTNVDAVAGAPSTAGSGELLTLRYFKENRKKFCYELPVVSEQTYSIAATFWYGNYDGLSKPPVFNMAIDATVTVTVDLTDNVYATTAMRREYIRRVAVDQTTMSVCLFPDSKSLTTPFISSLELRLLDPVAYVQPWLDEGHFLFQFLRQNFGGSTKFRYPDDAYDRIWWPSQLVGASTISTNVTIPDGGLGIKPPSPLLQTALTPTTLTDLVIPYKYGTASLGIDCIIYLYFSEIDPAATATSRLFTVSIPNRTPLPLTPVNIYNKTGGINKPLVYYWVNMTLTDTSVVTLTPETGSVNPPLVSGAELMAKFPQLVPPTNADDVAALATIKTALKLTSWSGDPCLPVPLDWIGCGSTASPRVVQVKLDNYNLTGEIPVAFAQLTALTSLTLSNNQLSGSIPDSLATLPALKELILFNNNLTGTVPAALSRPGLAIDIRGNPLSGGAKVPAAAAPSSAKSKSSNIGIIAGVVGGVLGVIAVGVLVGLLCFCRKRKQAKGDSLSELPVQQFSNGNVNGKAGNNGTTAVAEGSVQGAKAYSLAEITSATQNFNRKIGEGGFGPVYYGKLAGNREVAVKVSDVNSRQGVNEFNNEVQLLSRVHHKNLVSLVGYCLQGNNQMLVYEFLHRGTVREHLYGSPLAIQEPLDWKMRLDIALNSAQGLEYLHGGCTPSIIHRDVKSSNILLTDKYVAKVADFGLSRLGPEEGGATHVSTMVKGTAGYLDPEYWSTNNLTERSDVFSFGVVLLELLCGRQPIDNTLEDKSQWNISDKVRRSLQAGDIDSILDPVIKRCNPNMDSVWKVAEVALQSVEPKGVHRPFMRDVVKELREAIILETGHSQSYTTDHSGPAQGPRPVPRYQDNSSNSDLSVNFDTYKQGPQVR